MLGDMLKIEKNLYSSKMCEDRRLLSTIWTLCSLRAASKAITNENKCSQTVSKIQNIKITFTVPWQPLPVFFSAYLVPPLALPPQKYQWEHIFPCTPAQAPAKTQERSAVWLATVKLEKLIKIMHLRFANTVDRFQLSKCHTKLAVRKSNNLQSNKCGPTENVEHPRRFKHPRH